MGNIRKTAVLIISLLLLPIVVGAAQSQDPFYRHERASYQSQQRLLPNQSTGSYTYSIPLEEPLGRAGMQPDLQLNYRLSI